MWVRGGCLLRRRCCSLSRWEGKLTGEVQAKEGGGWSARDPLLKFGSSREASALPPVASIEFTAEG